MKKVKLVTLSLIIIILLSILFPLSVDAALLKVSSRIEEVYINGVPIHCELVNINDSNYLELRNTAHIFENTFDRFDIKWDDKTKTAEIIKEKAPSFESEFRHIYSKTANINKLNVLIDGKIKVFSSYLIDGRNYLKLRDVADLLNVDIDWNSTHNRIEISTGTPEGVEKLEINAELKASNIVSMYSERYGTKNTNFIIDNKDGTYGVLEEDDKGKLILDIYNVKDNKRVSNKIINSYLQMLGGFYSGEKYNYIVFGQGNLEEDRSKEVIRLVKYDKNFNEISHLSILGGESIVQMPFDAGNCNMDENGNTLVIHTSRTRFKSEDGLNHQSQLSMIIDTEKMELKEKIKAYQDNHVSHSFDQYVKFDGNNIIYLDHGDAYPRSIVLHKNNKPQDLFNIPGKIGMNATGISLGGLEVMDGGYLIAMNSINHSKATDYNHYSVEGTDEDQRDIVLLYSGKDNLEGFKGRNFEEKIIEKYVGTKKKSTVPKMIKLDKDKVLIMYGEYTLDNIYIGLRCREVDVSNGIKVIKDYNLPNYRLSKSQPKVIDGNIMWTVNRGLYDNNGRLLYKIKTK